MDGIKSPSAWGLVAAVGFLVALAAAALALPLVIGLALGPLWILVGTVVYLHRKKTGDAPLRVLEARLLLQVGVATTIVLAIALGALYVVSQLRGW